MSSNYKEKKVCLKCGEVYLKIDFLWQIYRASGIPYAKKDYSILICQDGKYYFTPSFQIKLNSKRYTYYVDYRDEKANDEIGENRCIMDGCNGELKSYIGVKYEILSPEKKKELSLKYFGENGTDVSEYDNMNLFDVFPNQEFVDNGEGLIYIVSV